MVRYSLTSGNRDEAVLVDDISAVDEAVLVRAQNDPAFFTELMTQLFGFTDTFNTSTEELLEASDEGRLVEFKSTARWNVREERKDKAMEHVIAKTVAGFLNGQGGTLLIGVNDDGHPIGLDQDFQLVKPAMMGTSTGLTLCLRMRSAMEERIGFKSGSTSLTVLMCAELMSLPHPNPFGSKKMKHQSFLKGETTRHALLKMMKLTRLSVSAFQAISNLQLHKVDF